MRTTPTKHTLPHVDGLEDTIFALLNAIIKADSPNESAPDIERRAIAKLITKLPARRGGLGLGDLAATASSAFVGSVALTGHIVKGFLDLEANPTRFAPDADTARLFPDVAAAFSDGSIHRIQKYAGKPISEFLDTKVTRVQHTLSSLAAKTAQTVIHERIEQPDDKAFFLSGGDEGAYWLMNAGSFKTRALTDSEFSVLVKARLGLRTVTGCSAPTPCPRCTHAPGTAPQLIGPSGTHILTCTEGGKGGARGQRNIRHALVKEGVRSSMVDTARSSTAVPAGEPFVSDHFPTKDGVALKKDSEKNRADITGIYMGRTILIDTVVCHPTVRSNKGVSTKPGLAADDAFKRKELQYGKLFDIPVGSLVPFAVETGGRWHPAARDFVKRWVKFGMAIGENHEPDLMNPVVRETYAARIAAFRANVSLALAIAVANTLLYGADHLSKGNVVLPPDDNSPDEDSDEDALAL